MRAPWCLCVSASVHRRDVLGPRGGQVCGPNEKTDAKTRAKTRRSTKRNTKRARATLTAPRSLFTHTRRVYPSPSRCCVCARHNRAGRMSFLADLPLFWKMDLGQCCRARGKESLSSSLIPASLSLPPCCTLHSCTCTLRSTPARRTRPQFALGLGLALDSPPIALAPPCTRFRASSRFVLCFSSRLSYPVPNIQQRPESVHFCFHAYA